MIKKNNETLTSEINALKQQLNAQKEVEDKLRRELSFLNLRFETLPNSISFKDKNGVYISCNQAEETARINEEKLKKISEVANDAILQMNHKGQIVFWNPAAEKIFGYTWDEIKFKDLHKLLVPTRYLLDFGKGFETFKKDGKGAVIGKTVELTALRRDGSEFEIELSLSSFKEKDEWSAVGLVRDISSRKAIEKEKEQLILNLKSALDEIKTLKGIVPICASCKKIRDDDGFWNQLETYIQNHSEAQFSHGICPDCAKELYPKYYKKSE